MASGGGDLEGAYGLILAAHVAQIVIAGRIDDAGVGVLGGDRLGLRKMSVTDTSKMGLSAALMRCCCENR